MFEIKLDPAAAGKPDGKAHVERYFRELHAEFAKYPGYTGGGCSSREAALKARDRLLTVRDILKVAEEFRLRHLRRELKGSRGRALDFYASTVRQRFPENLDELDVLLLKADQERRITREGVQFRTHFYKGDVDSRIGRSFLDLVGQKVRVRYHPDIDSSIIVYSVASGERLGEFYRDDIWRERGGSLPLNASYRRDLQSRTVEMAEFCKSGDRAVAMKRRANAAAQQSLELEAPAAPRMLSAGTKVKKSADNDLEGLFGD